MGSIEDLVAQLAGPETQAAIAAENPYFQFQKAPDLVNQGVMQALSQAPGKFKTRDAIALAFGSGLLSGGLEGAGQGYQTTLNNRLLDTANAIATGRSPSGEYLPANLFRRANDAVSVFQTRKALEQQKAKEDLGLAIENKITELTNPELQAAERKAKLDDMMTQFDPQIVNAQIDKERRLEAVRNGGLGETDPVVASALEKLADPNQGDGYLTQQERRAVIAKYGIRALSQISALRNSDTRTDSLNLRQYGGFKALGVEDPNSPYKPKDPKAFKKGLAERTIALDTKTGNSIKDIGVSVVNAINQLEVSKQALKKYKAAETQFGKNSEEAKALGEAVEQTHSGQLQLIQGMGSLAPLFTKGGMTDESRAQLGSLGVIPIKIYELDGLYDSLKASLQNPDFAVGKINDAQREMLQRFGDILDQSGLKYDKNIAGSKVVRHDEEGPFAPGQPLAPKKPRTIAEIKALGGVKVNGGWMIP